MSSDRRGEPRHQADREEGRRAPAVLLEPGPTDRVSRYRQALGSADPVAREVARRQLARLATAALRRHPSSRRSPWAHIRLDGLFAELGGNRIHQRADGRAETGHEPVHGSRSGYCVLLDLERSCWWCRGCGRAGDAAGYVMDVRGCAYRQAASWLTERYGPPAAEGLTNPTIAPPHRRHGRSYVSVVPIIVGVAP